MTAALDRAFKILELLAAHPDGLPLQAIADQLTLPKSAAHRLLADMIQQRYVRQEREGAPYFLTIRLVALGLSYLARNGILDVAQPILDRLAVSSGELVRLSVIENEELTFVAKAQGARFGLRYDPDMGMDVHLASTASGLAWLSTIDDEAALSLIYRQGLGESGQFGPNAPRTVREVLDRLHAARERGYALNLESFAPGMSTVAAPVRDSESGAAIGVISIAGPIHRLDEKRLLALAPELLAATEEMALASHASRWFGGRRHTSGSAMEAAE
ncbi:IclR family transcriptional regulator [Azospirillum canadense]|uniref:IclR family transcriptional regulator n=1 Tax=Azospirillum canadense TaxID=403962 RepID=UPI002225FCD1|nr:IclR family transcriptional regulator [Azospirillum canadense]MCW2242582.1 DNA-binding IclR family transcriptional regulator [Azospirillum canadense]